MLATLLTPKRSRITPANKERAAVAAAGDKEGEGYFYLDPAYDEIAATEEEEQKTMMTKPRSPLPSSSSS
jgi:hypothetical protein